jgi:hypothetical protein
MELIKEITKSKKNGKAYTNFYLLVNGTKVYVAPAGQYGTPFNKTQYALLNTLSQEKKGE